CYLHQLPQTPQNMRLKAILCLLILQGLRQIEIVRLNVTDLELVLGHARILGKGKDDTEAVDLHPETVLVLKDYLRVSKIADGALFTSSSNNSRNLRLTTKSIRNIVNPILRELGIKKSVHGFRHYFVTKLVKAYRGDLLEVCRYTRHRSIETLQIYNDNIKAKSDLPRYYNTFKSISLS
ncbi:MAG: tyrosine-type recombinase/integrase, partial [Nitrosotalea sp.]